MRSICGTGCIDGFIDNASLTSYIVRVAILMIPNGMLLR
jgi:hypothetical protein